MLFIPHFISTLSVLGELRGYLKIWSPQNGGPSCLLSLCGQVFAPSASDTHIWRLKANVEKTRSSFITFDHAWCNLLINNKFFGKLSNKSLV